MTQVSAASSVQRGWQVKFRTRKKRTPTITLYNPAAANAKAWDLVANADCSTTTAANAGEADGLYFGDAGAQVNAFRPRHDGGGTGGIFKHAGGRFDLYGTA